LWGHSQLFVALIVGIAVGVFVPLDRVATLATGGSINKVVRRVRSRVNKNKRRLSRP
jgi:hypothetical protein